MQWSPKNVWETRVSRLLPSSVLARFDRKCASIKEASVCVEVAKRAGGSSAAILAALYCYIVPVQLSGVTVRDIVAAMLYVGNSANQGAEGSVPSYGEEKKRKNARAEIVIKDFEAELSAIESRRRAGELAARIEYRKNKKIKNNYKNKQKQDVKGSNVKVDFDGVEGDFVSLANRIAKDEYKIEGSDLDLSAVERAATKGRKGRHTVLAFPYATRLNMAVGAISLRARISRHGYEACSGLLDAMGVDISSVVPETHDGSLESRLLVVGMLDSLKTWCTSKAGARHLREHGRSPSGRLETARVAEKVSGRGTRLSGGTKRRSGGVAAAWATYFGNLRNCNTYEACAAVVNLLEAGVIPDTAIWPLKDHPGAYSRVNLYVSDVLVDVKRYFGNRYHEIPFLLPLLLKMHNDMASGWLIWYVAMAQHDVDFALLVSSLAHEEAQLKELSTLIKSLGVNSTHEGAMCCELNTLVGRGAKPGNADKDVSTRINTDAFVKEKRAHVNPEKLRVAIRRVLDDELAAKPRWMDRDDYWSRRWEFTKAGSHTRHIEDVMFGGRLELPPQPTRREFAEAISTNMVGYGKPEVYAGLSWKLEQGKTRAIYGCDSRSYFTFDYLLRPIEAVWRGRRTLLDPGAEPQAKMYTRLSKLNTTFYMLDFDDYNSQHELSAMKMVFEEACRDAPQDVLEWALESWDNMYVRWTNSDRELECRRMVGTLPSGHRATTFVNTVLNTAYCMVEMGEHFDQVQSMHAGDDVILWGSDDHVHNCIMGVEGSELRVNRSKQSVGNVCGEFLRVAFGKREAYGYLARGIAGMVAGNWVSEAAIAPRAYMLNYARGGWTLSSRSRVRNLGCLLTSSLMRRTSLGRQQAHDICSNRVSVDGSPIMTDSGGNYVMYNIVGGRARDVRADRRTNLTHATDDYIASHIDHAVLKEAGVEVSQVRSLMLKASHKHRGDSILEELKLQRVECPDAGVIGFEPALFFRERERNSNEAVNILERLFSAIDWRSLIASVRGTSSDSLTLTGKSDWPMASPMGVTYADVNAMRYRFTRPMYIRPTYRLYV